MRAELSLAARGHGVLIEAGDVFFLNPPDPCPYFRLRLSSIAAGSIAAGIRALGLAVGELARRRAARRVPSSPALAAPPIEGNSEPLAPSRRARWPFRRPALGCRVACVSWRSASARPIDNKE